MEATFPVPVTGTGGTGQTVGQTVLVFSQVTGPPSGGRSTGFSPECGHRRLLFPLWSLYKGNSKGQGRRGAGFTTSTRHSGILPLGPRLTQHTQLRLLPIALEARVFIFTSLTKHEKQNKNIERHLNTRYCLSWMSDSSSQASPG